jgi:glycosyltransferase involved in cell wall biosynthesis
MDASPLQPLVSVVIPAYNAEAFVARAIASALAQTWTAREIVVVDDGSTDATATVVKSFGEQVRYLHQPNAGQVAATNRGIQAARGAIVALLDADDEWLPERLAKTVAPMVANPLIGLAYCHATDVFPDGRRRLHNAPVSHRSPLGIYPPPRICTPAATFRREALDQCGLFDPEQKTFFDADLFIRVAERWFVHEVPEQLVRVHLRADSQRHGYDADLCAAMILRYTIRALGRGHKPYNRRGALAQAHLAAGIQYLDAWRRAPALKSFFKSLCLRPSLRACSLILRTPAPRRLVAAARRWKHGSPES